MNKPKFFALIDGLDGLDDRGIIAPLEARTQEALNLECEKLQDATGKSLTVFDRRNLRRIAKEIEKALS